MQRKDGRQRNDDAVYGTIDVKIDYNVAVLVYSPTLLQ